MRTAPLHALAAASAIAAIMLASPPSDGGRGGSARAAELPPARGAATGGSIAPGFVGLSVEWSLVERYMGPRARPAFANLLRNLGAGVLRIGGDTQDLMPFTPRAADSERVITPADLRAIRATLDAAGGPERWTTTLGTALAPRVGPERVRRFVRDGVAPAFAGAERAVAGIELGNEPDLTYRGDRARYLADLARNARALGRFALVGPGTSEAIEPWAAIARRATATRFFWDWEAILGRAPLRLATDHFYPLAHDCAGAPYRCATIPRLLSDERADNLAHQVYEHATAAARHGLGYRIEETNSAANRGAAGVSDVAASAVWALDAMFTAACPRPPARPAANARCALGASGMNFHSAEAEQPFGAAAGNARYNPIRFDSGAGAPQAAPEYYALLLFARFAAGTDGLRPLALDAPRQVKAWRVVTASGTSRIFVINRGAGAARVSVPATAGPVALDRMAPHDPRGAGRTLSAPEVRIDGRAVARDGRWPGFAPAQVTATGGRLQLTIGGGEAVVITLSDGA